MVWARLRQDILGRCGLHIQEGVHALRQRREYVGANVRRRVQAQRAACVRGKCAPEATAGCAEDLNTAAIDTVQGQEAAGRSSLYTCLCYTPLRLDLISPSG